MDINASAPPPLFVFFFSCAAIALSLPEKAHMTLCYGINLNANGEH
jgi:hypothetical protein